VCVRHGANVSLCNIEACTTRAKKGGVCIRHGAKKRSNVAAKACTNHAVKGGVCVRQSKAQMMQGCLSQARNGGVCWRHGANKRSNGARCKGAQTKCFVDSCTKYAQPWQLLLLQMKIDLVSLRHNKKNRAVP
jgi:hypothetical protein